MLASDTAPVREVIRDGETGLLAPFYDIDRWCERANAVLDDPAAHRPLGEAAAALVRERYSVETCLPKMLKLFRGALRGRTPPGSPRPAREAFTLSGVAVG